MLVRLGEGMRMAGPTGNYGPGEVVEVADAVGEVLVANGLAVEVAVEAAAPVSAIPEVETAVETPPEAATASPQRRRTRKKAGTG